MMFWPELRGRWLVRVTTWIWAGLYAAWAWVYAMWQAILDGMRTEKAWRKFHKEEQELRRLGR